MAYRYYSILRPVGPGTFPNHDVKALHNFSTRIYVESIGREAWGFLDYAVPLSDDEASSYDLLFLGYVQDENGG